MHSYKNAYIHRWGWPAYYRNSFKWLRRARYDSVGMHTRFLGCRNFAPLRLLISLTLRPRVYSPHHQDCLECAEVAWYMLPDEIPRRGGFILPEHRVLTCIRIPQRCLFHRRCHLVLGILPDLHVQGTPCIWHCVGRWRTAGAKEKKEQRRREKAELAEWQQRAEETDGLSAKPSIPIPSSVSLRRRRAIRAKPGATPPAAGRGRNRTLMGTLKSAKRVVYNGDSDAPARPFLDTVGELALGDDASCDKLMGEDRYQMFTQYAMQLMEAPPAYRHKALSDTLLRIAGPCLLVCTCV